MYNPSDAIFVAMYRYFNNNWWNIFHHLSHLRYYFLFYYGKYNNMLVFESISFYLDHEEYLLPFETWSFLFSIMTR